MTLSVHAARLRLQLLDLEFQRICQEGRESPVPIQAYVEHRIKWMKANDDLYVAMWMEVADTGVQIIRGVPGARTMNTVKKG